LREAALIHVVAKFWQRAMVWLAGRIGQQIRRRGPMNQIIYIVGLVVIVLFILGYLGLR
jgi:hypothetical protein